MNKKKLTLVIEVSDLTAEQIVAFAENIKRVQKKHDRKTGVMPRVLDHVKALTDAIPKEGKIASSTVTDDIARHTLVHETNMIIKVEV